MDDQELLDQIRAQADLLRAVATGGPQIDSVNAEYKERRSAIRTALDERGIVDPNPFADLWRWYAYWRDNLPSYASRRLHVSEIYQPLEELVESHHGQSVDLEPTGWPKVDRQMTVAVSRLKFATNEEDFQAVGFLCTQVMISLAQAVRDFASFDGDEPSESDAKRILEGFVLNQLPGGSNEEARKAVRSTISFANAVKHDRGATYLTAALCLEATRSSVSQVALLAGRASALSPTLATDVRAAP